MKIDLNKYASAKLLEKSEGEFWIEEAEMANCLSRALKALRKHSGYSLKQVSEGTEIPFPTVARYENGENIPGVVQALKLAHFYGVSIDDMLLLGADADSCDEFFAL